jgi:hypothetical protein
MVINMGWGDSSRVFDPRDWNRTQEEAKGQA